VRIPSCCVACLALLMDISQADDVRIEVPRGVKVTLYADDATLFSAKPRSRAMGTLKDQKLADLYAFLESLAVK
jgi:hypothetical protein